LVSVRNLTYSATLRSILRNVEKECNDANYKSVGVKKPTTYHDRFFREANTHYCHGMEWNGMINNATMLMILINGLITGLSVSL